MLLLRSYRIDTLIHLLIILRGYIIGRNHLQEGVDTVLVVNPNSSSGLTGRGWNELYSEIKKALGVNVKVALTKKPGDGTVLARKFLNKDSKSCGYRWRWNFK